MRALELRSWLTIRSPSIVSPPLSRLCTGFRSPWSGRARRTPYLGRTREPATCGVRRASTVAPPQAGRPLWHPRVGGLTDTGRSPKKVAGARDGSLPRPVAPATARRAPRAARPRCAPGRGLYICDSRRSRPCAPDAALVPGASRVRHAHGRPRDRCPEPQRAEPRRASCRHAPRDRAGRDRLREAPRRGRAPPRRRRRRVRAGLLPARGGGGARRLARGLGGRHADHGRAPVRADARARRAMGARHARGARPAPRAGLTRKWGAPTWPPNPPQTLGAPRQSRGAPRHSDRLLLLGRRRCVGSRRLSRPLEPPGLALLVEPDRHLDLGLPPVAQERHAHLLADRRRGNDPLQIAWPLERRAVELHDDVVRAHPAALGGFARHDVADQHAARLAQLEARSAGSPRMTAPTTTPLASRS